MRIKRKVVKLDPNVYEKLVKFKEAIHQFESKGKLPMSWNSFFTLIISDWENSRAKCHCNHFYDCDHCRMVDEISRGHGKNWRR